MEFKYAACSRKSKKHDTNEDNIFINGSYYKTKEKTDDLINGESSEQTQMFAVFDGFGQNNTGYKASYIASGILEKYKKAGRQPNFNVYKFLDGYVLEANRVILENVNANNGLQFGTSAGLLYISANRAFMYNLGDVRVYLYRDCELMQLSEDHTQAQRMVNLGVLRKEKARIHSQKDKLTQYLGMKQGNIPMPQKREVTLKNGDILLIMNKGIYDYVDIEQFGSILEPADGIQLSSNIVDRFIKEALSNSSSEDMSIFVVKVSDKVAAGGNVTGKKANESTNGSVGGNIKNKSIKYRIWPALTFFCICMGVLIIMASFGGVIFSESYNSDSGGGNTIDPILPTATSDTGDPNSDYSPNELPDIIIPDDNNPTTTSNTPNVTEKPEPTNKPVQTVTPQITVSPTVTPKPTPQTTTAAPETYTPTSLITPTPTEEITATPKITSTPEATQTFSEDTDG